MSNTRQRGHLSELRVSGEEGRQDSGRLQTAVPASRLAANGDRPLPPTDQAYLHSDVKQEE